MNEETPNAVTEAAFVPRESSEGAANGAGLAAARGQRPSAGTPGAESDEMLMSAYRDGDAAAFDALYARHRAPVYRYFRRQVAAGEAADELFQDVWMRVIDARGTYEPRAKFTTWLYTIAHNRLMDFYRARQRASLESLDADESLVEGLAAPDADLPESIAARKEAGLRLMRAISALPPLQRDAFLLHEEGGLTLEEIADLIGTQRETIKSRIRYALVKLRRELKNVDIG